MITVKNLRKEKPFREYQIKIDRSSIFGNPFPLKKENQFERNQVCELYKNYFYNRIDTDITFKNAVYNLLEIYNRCGRLELFCWCSPKQCHGDTIKEFLLNNCLSNIN